ncbi:hypothetical protein CDL15_Pgr026090 [Punica granatum]|uniref:Uncharacterized protein n=1 Tax=Punica granatum TaxID=22663 RepID=A0A218WD30_PUNGR|nr:hypothetical protein CDL15_Pgr026090 [Punica granatum]
MMNSRGSQEGENRDINEEKGSPMLLSVAMLFSCPQIEPEENEDEGNQQQLELLTGLKPRDHGVGVRIKKVTNSW